ncbi:MAG: hypothetical protein U1F43_27110 [Myxococcota bacterium]
MPPTEWPPEAFAWSRRQLDLTPYLNATPIVAEQGGQRWLALRDAAGIILLWPVPAPRGACATKPGADSSFVFFPSDPPAALELGSEPRLWAWTGRCWSATALAVAPGRTLASGKGRGQGDELVDIPLKVGDRAFTVTYFGSSIGVSEEYRETFSEDLTSDTVPDSTHRVSARWHEDGWFEVQVDDAAGARPDVSARAVTLVANLESGRVVRRHERLTSSSAGGRTHSIDETTVIALSLPRATLRGELHGSGYLCEIDALTTSVSAGVSWTLEAGRRVLTLGPRPVDASATLVQLSSDGKSRSATRTLADGRVLRVTADAGDVTLAVGDVDVTHSSGVIAPAPETSLDLTVSGPPGCLDAKAGACLWVEVELKVTSTTPADCAADDDECDSRPWVASDEHSFLWALAGGDTIDFYSGETH